MIPWKLFYENSSSTDSMIDFINGVISFDEFVQFSPKEAKKPLKDKFLWAKGHPSKRNITASEYMQDLVAANLRRNGAVLEKINRNFRYDLIGWKS